MRSLYGLETNPGPGENLSNILRPDVLRITLSGTFINLRLSRLSPKRNFKESTRPKAVNLGAQHVKCYSL